MAKEFSVYPGDISFCQAIVSILLLHLDVAFKHTQDFTALFSLMRNKIIKYWEQINFLVTGAFLPWLLLSCLVLIWTPYPHHGKWAKIYFSCGEFRIVKIIEDIAEMHCALEIIEMVFI